jgi:putative DNA primase/helicase
LSGLQHAPARHRQEPAHVRLLSVDCGRVRPSPPPERDEGAWQKRLLSAFLAAPPAIWLDNISERLDSATLAGALTTPYWTDRILGHSRMADVPIRNVWVATMNNPSISGKLTRRGVPIYLDAQVPEPWMRSGPAQGRTWQRPLPGYAFEKRARFVYAALVLVQNYLTGNDPEYGEARTSGTRFLGMYERWSEVMGGILAAAGVDGFLTNRELLHIEADEDRDDDVAPWGAKTRSACIRVASRLANRRLGSLGLQSIGGLLGRFVGVRAC